MGRFLKEHSDIESDDDQINPTKRKPSFLGKANDTESGSSSTVGCSPAPPHSKKRKLTIDLEDLAKNWQITNEDVREIMMDHNASFRKRRDECRSIKHVQIFAPANAQETNIHLFNIDVAKKSKSLR